MKMTVLALLLCAAYAYPAFAAHPLATDDSGTNGKNKVQLETSAEFVWDKQGSVKTESKTFNAALSLGLLDNLDVSLATPYVWQKQTASGVTLIDNNGNGDTSLALKWRFLELGQTSFALKPEVAVPTGDHARGFGAGRPAYGLTLITTVEFKELPMPLAIHANLGYSHQKLIEADRLTIRSDYWKGSLALTAEVLKGLQAVLEGGVETNGDKTDSKAPAFVTGGIIYSTTDWLDFSLGIKYGVNAPADDFGILTGLTFKFP